jgi:hypothetical protein
MKSNNLKRCNFYDKVLVKTKITTNTEQITVLTVALLSQVVLVNNSCQLTGCVL